MAGTTAARRPRKAAAPKKTAAAPAVVRKRVTLDLDALTKQDAFPDLNLPAKPFTFLLNGVDYELRDPRDSDWKLSLQLVRNPFALMRNALVDADEPIEDPTEDEIRMARERVGLPPDPFEKDSDQAKQEEADWPDGVPVCLIDRFSASYLPSWKLNALFQRWHEHWRIPLDSDGKGILDALLGRVG